MDTQTTEPDTARLRQLLEGTLPEEEAAELMARIEEDTEWQAALERLAADEESWAAAAAHLRGPAESITPTLYRAIEQMTSLAGSAAESGDDAAATGTAPYAGDEWREFLAASDDPRSLGRLGQYEILDVLGRGGMGIVLKAFDPKLQRLVAVKMLAPQLAANPVARRRFVREAQAAAAVVHENVITTHAVEEQGPVPYLVMQLVGGVSLQQRLNERGPLGLKEILRIGMQTAQGLAAAHAQGLIHRDIKPANILLENGTQRVKITDFGLARAVDDASLSQSGIVVGTPQYMAPEQARGEAVDHRSDLFSLGSVLYAMCTGRPPFRGSTVMGVLRRVSTAAPPAIRDLNPDIPEWLRVIIGTLHAKNPDERYQTAAEVARLLEKLLARLQHPARLRHSSDALEAYVADVGDKATTEAVPRPRRRGGRSLVAAALLLLVGAGGVLGVGYARGWFAPGPPAEPESLDAPDLLDSLTAWAASIPEPGLCGVWQSTLGEFELSHPPIKDRERVVVTGRYSHGFGTIRNGSYNPVTRVFQCELSRVGPIGRVGPSESLTLTLSADGRTLRGKQTTEFSFGLGGHTSVTEITMTLKKQRPCPE